MKDYLQCLMDSSLDLIFTVKKDGAFGYFNRRLKDLTGYTATELLGKHFMHIIPAEEKGFMREKLEEINKGISGIYETKIIKKDGTIADVQVSQSVLEGYDEFLGVLSDITERKQAEEELNQLAHELGERVKEMNCLYGALKLMAEPGKSLDEVLQEIVYLIPHSLQYPDITCARIIFEGNQFKTENFNETEWRQSADILVFEEQIGSLEVFYLQEKPPIHEEPFLRDERELIDTLAREICKYIERKRAEEELQKAFSEIKELKEQLYEENIYLRKEIKLEHEHGQIVGQSHAIKHVLAQAEQVADTDSTVLILGETGTGKELLAHTIHNLSRRKGQTFVTVSCAALPPTLIESELFGHEKGAFTGALSKQMGRFEIADGSTLFLDEISELSMELQAKLLRVLQEGQFERIGSPRTIEVDVRIIAATNRDLSKAVLDGKFREDLYYRLNVFPITIPPLRQRREDIPLFVWSFVSDFAKKMGKRIESIPVKAMKSMQSYNWPGNVRELRNVIERAMIMTTGFSLNIDVPKILLSTTSQGGTLQEIDRKHIIDVLKRTGWRVSGENGAAEILGLKPTTLHSKMNKFGIKRKNQI